MLAFTCYCDLSGVESALIFRQLCRISLLHRLFNRVAKQPKAEEQHKKIDGGL